MNKEIMGPLVLKGGDESRAPEPGRGRDLLSLGSEGSSAPLTDDAMRMPNRAVPHTCVWRRVGGVQLTMLVQMPQMADDL